MSVVEAALRGARARPGLRVTHVSVQGNHVHLIAEASDQAALASGMKAFSIRLAKGMNRLMDRFGSDERPELVEKGETWLMRNAGTVTRRP
jgi:REP element-mobilizing transposase RayT